MLTVFPIGRVPIGCFVICLSVATLGSASLLAADGETRPGAKNSAELRSDAAAQMEPAIMNQGVPPALQSHSTPHAGSARGAAGSAAEVSPSSALAPSGELAAPSLPAGADLASSSETSSATNGGQAFDEVTDDLPLFSPRLLREFYSARGFRPAWTSARAIGMLGLIQESVAHGLEPNDFNLKAIASVLAGSELERIDDELMRWRADLILSDSLLRYLHHLQYGKYNPREINPDWTFVDSIDAAELQAEMREVLAADDLASAVERVLPDAPFYDYLKLGYARYLLLSERLQHGAGWAPIPAGPNLKIGMRDERLSRIRDQLALLDGYDFPPAVDPDVYDQALYDAVREFQGRSGLAQDGVIGPRTLAALNHPLDERLAAIRANLERMRWLYHELPSDYLLVDIAAFQVELVRDHQPVWSTRTIVGTDENQTPMFRDEMEHLVFNPTWSVPRSIQEKMRGVPGDYKVIDRRTGRRVYPANPTDPRRYRLVQQPGPKNALGRVKFMFPNGHAIYLHDTPSRYLFARSRRSYSHGCVRVEDPLDLAREVLAGQNWDMSAIKRVVSRGRTRYVNLDQHLPVLLYYLTARADEHGRVGFRRDLYERDASLLARLDGPAGAERIVFNEEPATDAELQSAPTSVELPATSSPSPDRVASSSAPETEAKPSSNLRQGADPDVLSFESDVPMGEHAPSQGPDPRLPKASADQQRVHDSGLGSLIRAQSAPIAAMLAGRRGWA